MSHVESSVAPVKKEIESGQWCWNQFRNCQGSSSNKLPVVVLLSSVEVGLISTLNKWVHGKWSFEENLAASDFLNCCMNLDYSASAESQLY